MKMKHLLFGVVAALAVASVGPREAYAETFKKLHPTVQKVLTATDYVGAVSSNSLTIDLSGGDFDKISCAIYVSSANSTGTPTLDAAIQVSPDGGTNYSTAGSFTQIASTTTSVGTLYLKQSIETGPGTKARIKFTGSANTQWWDVSAWCMPNTN